MEFIIQNQVFFIVILAVITLILSIYLGILMKKLKQQKHYHETILEEQRRKAQERAEYYKESIIMISRATIQGQCETSEACIRIKKLLENFPTIADETDFGIIETMYKDLEEFPYLEKRQELSKQEVYAQDKKRFKVEEKYNDDFIIALKKLVHKFESLH